MAMLKYVETAFKGTPQARATHKEALQNNPDILTGIATLQALCPVNPDDDPEEPIFLLSAGWRSGSTLVQRLIMSAPNVFIWGEPYDECGIIQALADTTKAFRAGWPLQEYYYDGSPPNQLSGNWIANLFPSPQELRHAHRAFFDTMFAEPAKRAGATRWGIKEVRLGIEHGIYLRWLYPKAKFLFLYRNPLDAYQSYRRYGRNWYNTWPDKPMFTSTSFGEHWRKLVMGFLKGQEDIDALVIRYEDLIEGRMPISNIEQHLGVEIDRSILGTKVGSSQRDGERARASHLEKWLLKRAVSPIAKVLGYEW
jgi:hypothetical protein